VRRLGDHKGRQAVDAVLVEDEPASGYRVHLGIGRDDAEPDGL